MKNAIPTAERRQGAPLQAVRAALQRDRTIDIVTTGARSGQPRRVEIWFTNISGRIVICGTPSADGEAGERRGRHWLANLRACPVFEFVLKESLTLAIPAKARVVDDLDERRLIMSAPETVWYRERGFGIDELILGSPIVDVRFLGTYEPLNRRHENDASSMEDVDI